MRSILTPGPASPPTGVTRIALRAVTAPAARPSSAAPAARPATSVADTLSSMPRTPSGTPITETAATAAPASSPTTTIGASSSATIRIACQRVPPRRRMVASSPRRSAVAIAAVLTSASAANAIDSPMITHTPQAPLWPSVRTVPRYSARVSTCVPGCAVGALAGHEHRRVGGDRGVALGERAVHDHVAEAGGAVVDRGDPQRRLGRVLEPGGQDVADLHVALGGDDVADRDGGAADVAEVAVADAEVERAGGVAEPGRRPRRVPAGQALAEQEHLGRDHARAAEPLGGAGGERRAVAAGHDVVGGDALGGDGLGVVARARGEHALRADQHRDQHDRRRQRGACASGSPTARCSPAAPRGRGRAAGGRAARPGGRAASARAARCRPPAGCRRGSRTPTPARP